MADRPSSLGSGQVEYHEDRHIIHFGLPPQEAAPRDEA